MSGLDTSQNKVERVSKEQNMNASEYMSVVTCQNIQQERSVMAEWEEDRRGGTCVWHTSASFF